MTDELTRIRIDNSKGAADAGRSISISALADLIEAGDPEAELTRLKVDNSKGSADSGKSCSLAQIAAVIAGGDGGGVTGLTRLLIDNSKGNADQGHSVSIAEVSPIVVPDEGGGGGYAASAVHLDGSVLLDIANLAAATTNKLSCAFWFKCDFSATVDFFVSDPDAAYNPWGTFQDNGAISKGIGFTLNGDGGSPFLGTFTWPNLHLNDGNWHFAMASFESNAADPQPSKFYIDGVDQTESEETSPEPLTFTLNDKRLVLFGDSYGNNIVADIADFRLDTASWLTAGDFTPTTLGYFRDAMTGKPVDPAVATAALGTPMVLFSGNSMTFATNQGTGGAFTLTGSLTNASTSPSD